MKSSRRLPLAPSGRQDRVSDQCRASPARFKADLNSPFVVPAEIGAGVKRLADLVGAPFIEAVE